MFSKSWELGLNNWLDPNGTGPAYIDSYPAFETFAVDGGILSVDSPATGNLSANENITISIRNFGQNDLTNFDISFKLIIQLTHDNLWPLMVLNHGTRYSLLHFSNNAFDDLNICLCEIKRLAKNLFAAS